MTACIVSPMMTVMVYMPNWPPISVISSISTIFPAIRNIMPIGAYLRWEDKLDSYYCFGKQAILNYGKENVLSCQIKCFSLCFETATKMFTNATKKQCATVIYNLTTWYLKVEEAFTCVSIGFRRFTQKNTLLKWLFFIATLKNIHTQKYSQNRSKLNRGLGGFESVNHSEP